jgi:hypothetical protein
MAAISSSIIVLAGTVAIGASTVVSGGCIQGPNAIPALIGAVLCVSGFVGWIATVWRSGSGNGSKKQVGP